MADEPGGWELKRSIDKVGNDVDGLGKRLEARLDKVVTQEAFNAEQRRVDDKFKDLAEDIAAERALRQAAIDGESVAREKGDAHQQEALDRLIANQKWIAIAILLPIGLFLANLYFARGK